MVTMLGHHYLLYCLIFSILVISSNAWAYDRTPLALSKVSREDSKLRSGVALQRTFENNTCTSKKCQQTASTILKNMNLDAKPCDNFYEFACGGFLKTAAIPNDRAGIDTNSKADDYLKTLLKASLEEKIQAKEIKPFKLAKTLYKSCMNQCTEPLLKILKELGEWPVLSNNWNNSTFDWKKAVYANRKLGYPTSQFISFSIFEDLKNSTSRIIYLGEASLALEPGYLTNGLDDGLVKAYYRFMTEVAVALGAKRDRATSELLESLNFEISLANNSRNKTELYNPMSVEELSRAYPSIPWLEYLNAELAPDQQIKSNEIVIVSFPKYFKNLEKLLKQTPKRVQANYVMWRIVEASVYLLSDDVKKWEEEFVSTLTGNTERRPRWEECVNVVSNRMHLSVGAEGRLTAVLPISLFGIPWYSQASWMDEETRAAALEKVNMMKSSVGYPVELLDDKKLEEYYAPLEITDGQYLNNILTVDLFSKNRHFRTFRKPVNKTDWMKYGDVAYVNAYYSFFDNSIQIPAGILLGDLLNKDRPHYVNYGTIGGTIGHEISHGFDDEGCQFDKKENLANWWRKETRDKFLQRAQCLINQYGNYTQKQIQMKLNGFNTQGENIADNGGIKVAYLAYNEWERKNGLEPRLPGLNYTSQQMFWISVANEACGKYTLEYLKSRILTGEHSLNKFRVIGPLSNMPEFAKDFECPSGSPMNPVQKCSLW